MIAVQGGAGGDFGVLPSRCRAPSEGRDQGADLDEVHDPDAQPQVAEYEPHHSHPVPTLSTVTRLPNADVPKRNRKETTHHSEDQGENREGVRLTSVLPARHQANRRDEPRWWLGPIVRVTVGRFPLADLIHTPAMLSRFRGRATAMHAVAKHGRVDRARLSRFPLNFGGGPGDRQAAITGSS